MAHLYLLGSGLTSSIRQWVPSLLIAAVVWAISKAIYNLYFHPLSKYPGPKFAAASIWWQVWLEAISGQSLSLKLLELHGIYGAFTYTQYMLTLCLLTQWQATLFG